MLGARSRIGDRVVDCRRRRVVCAVGASKHEIPAAQGDGPINLGLQLGFAAGHFFWRLRAGGRIP
jgi:hypothetical protein